MALARRSAARQFGALSAIAAGFLGGCAPVQGYVPLGGTTEASTEGLGRLAKIEKFAVAFETTPGCKLEMTTSAGQPTDAAWKPIDASTLVKGIYTVKERIVHTESAGVVDFVALQVRDGVGTTAWLRNVPTERPDEVAARWRCVVDMKFVTAHLPKLNAKSVRLNPRAPGCTSITPIAGTADDVTFGPYGVAAIGLFAGRTAARAGAGGQGALTVGVTLESQGGQKRLVIPASTLDACFVATKAPVADADVRALGEWIASPTPSDTPIPAVSLDVFQAVTGIDPASCIKEGFGPTEHIDCRAPFLRVLPVEVPGDYGARPVLFGADRRVGSVHAYGGKLVSETEINDVLAIVRTPKIKEVGFTRLLQDALRSSAGDPAKKRLRQSQGYRFVRTEDLAGATAKVAFVDVELTYRIGEVEATADRLLRPAGGPRISRGSTPNPARILAQEEVRNAVDARSQAERVVALAKASADAVKKACPSEPATEASAACKALLSSDENASAAERLVRANTRQAKATTALSGLPETLAVDDDPTSSVVVKGLQRKGEANLRITIATGEGAPFSVAMVLPFAAADVEVSEDLARDVRGHAARPPTTEDAERALADLVLAALDSTMVKWRVERALNGEVGSMRLGSRAWAASVAMRTSADQPVKLLADFLENRAEVLARPRVLYPVKVPADARNRCLTFVASGLDVTKDVNLELGAVVNGGFVPIHRDLREGSDAAFEVCHLIPGSYAVAISFAKDVTDPKRPGHVQFAPRPPGVLVSMFDSTAKAILPKESRDSLRGAPPVPQKNDKLTLDANRAPVR